MFHFKAILVADTMFAKFSEQATYPLLFVLQKDGKIGISENKANLTLASSTAVYENPTKDRNMILVSTSTRQSPRKVDANSRFLD